MNQVFISPSENCHLRARFVLAVLLACLWSSAQVCRKRAAPIGQIRFERWPKPTALPRQSKS